MEISCESADSVMQILLNSVALPLGEATSKEKYTLAVLIDRNEIQSNRKQLPQFDFIKLMLTLFHRRICMHNSIKPYFNLNTNSELFTTEFTCLSL